VDADIARWTVASEVYPEKATRALQNYADHLRDSRLRLSEGIRGLKRELEAYGMGSGEGLDEEDEASRAGKQRTMKEMARVYRDMERQVAEVRADLERLGKA
jgi:hypothetical protein